MVLSLEMIPAGLIFCKPVHGANISFGRIDSFKSIFHYL